MDQCVGMSRVEMGLSGNANLEPSQLGDIGTLSSRRARGWTKLLEDNQLCLINPPLEGADRLHDVRLPLRKRKIRIAAGHTHHCASGTAGRPRAIDIGAVSPSLACALSSTIPSTVQATWAAGGASASSSRRATTSCWSSTSKG